MVVSCLEMEKTKHMTQEEKVRAVTRMVELLGPERTAEYVVGLQSGLAALACENEAMMSLYVGSVSQEDADLVDGCRKEPWVGRVGVSNEVRVR